MVCTWSAWWHDLNQRWLSLLGLDELNVTFPRYFVRFIKNNSSLWIIESNVLDKTINKIILPVRRQVGIMKRIKTRGPNDAYTSDQLNGIICLTAISDPSLIYVLLTKSPPPSFQSNMTPFRHKCANCERFYLSSLCCGVLVSVDLETRRFNLKSGGKLKNRNL